jgi:hypothetical protein
LAKEAAQKENTIMYSKVPRNIIKSEIQKTNIEMWQREWDTSIKGQETKNFFPNIIDRLKRKIPVTPNFTTMVTGHGKLKSYFYRLHIIEDPGCTCNQGDQTVEHLLMHCTKLISNVTS